MTQTNAEKQATARQRRETAYKIVKAMACAAGVALPNARNEGQEFDAWLAGLVDAMERQAEKAPA